MPPDWKSITPRQRTRITWRYRVFRVTNALRAGTLSRLVFAYFRIASRVPSLRRSFWWLLAGLSIGPFATPVGTRVFQELGGWSGFGLGLAVVALPTVCMAVSIVCTVRSIREIWSDSGGDGQEA